MSSLLSLAQTKATAVWFGLTFATVVSWLLGTGETNTAGDDKLTGVVILLMAFVKIRFVGMYFMELRKAPIELRGLFEAYCLVVCSVVLGMYAWV